MVPGENTQCVPIQDMYAIAEPKAACIIRDLTGELRHNHGYFLKLPVSTTAVKLMEEVGKKFEYLPNSFDLVLQTGPEREPISIGEQGDHTLGELGFRCDDWSKNDLIITNKHGCDAPKKIGMLKKTKKGNNDEKLEMVLRNEVSTDGTGDAASTHVPPPPPYTPGSTDFYSYSYSNAVVRQETGFVGLVNQAMTCYLNSLLQTLYMTPEFRNALYRWEFDGTEEEGVKSIPFQLQKLFLLLQTCKKPAVGTTELTTSFGWDSNEAWQQHDVQELCRVMFDALEQKFKNTGQSDLISRLYEGKLKDYVKCLRCGYESAREDTFLDVPLVVRPFGSSQAYASVEEALHAFVTPETLEGSNQYFCEQCNKKCDAHKGLKFIKFPYLLTLQLKRFDFDPSTMHRMKLNDRVSFPEILNLNGFIKMESVEETSDDGDTTDSGSALDDESLCCTSGFKTGCSFSPEAGSDNGDMPDDDEGIDVGPNGQVHLGHNHEMSSNEKNLRKSLEKGPYVYELFSIMVHSGSANGGHYYAYIKSFKDGEFYCFNDAQVTRVTDDDIQKTYGGGPPRGYYSSSYSSSTNAYMLMFRQIDKEKNAQYMSPEEFPEHIKVLLQCMQEQEERERQQRELDRSLCKIKLFGPQPNQQRMAEMRLKVHKDCTLAEATMTAHKILGLHGYVPLECCRLVIYDDFHDSLECSFVDADDQPMGELLGGVKSNYKFDLLLEVRKPNEQFQQYKPGGTTVKVYVVDTEKDEVSPYSHTVRSHLSETVEEFRRRIAEALNVDGSTMRIVMEVYNSDMKLLNNHNKTLKSEGFVRSNKVFVEYKDPADAEKPFSSSKFYNILDRYEHTICVYVGLPKVDKDILERLRIQENDYDEGREESGSDGDVSEDISNGCSVEKLLEKSIEEMPVNSSHQSSRDIRGKFPTGIGTSFSSCGECCTLNLVSSKVNSEGAWLDDIKSVHSSCGVDGSKRIQMSVTPDDSSQDYDEGLGDSEVGDTYSSNGYHNNQAVHSDQSEDSSLTDSERTLVGDELSPRNNSPDIMGSEIEQDSEPLQHASVEGLKPECDSKHHVGDINCLLNPHSEFRRNLSSPEENTKDSKCSVCSKTHSCDNVLSTNQLTESQNQDIKRYFRAWPYTDYESGEKMLRIYVDKRITLAAVKRELEPYVGVKADCFKIYRLYSNNQEFECTRLSENLMSYTEDTRLNIKLGRALRKGEYKVKVYQLCVNETESCKSLIDWVFAKGMTVFQAKREILPEIKDKCGLDIPLNRCRLRKKSWKNPGTIFLDNQRFEKDIPITPNWEVFLEILAEAETVESTSQLAIFTRRWRPDVYQIDPFQEVVLESPSVEALKAKISEISNISEEHVEFAKGQGTFPCDISLLSIHKELDWHSNLSSLNTWPLCIGDDGYVVYYRDRTIKLKPLSEEEKREISNKENARSNKIQKTTCSPRKEKALKIYTLDSSPSGPCGSSAISLSKSRKPIVPDLD